MIIKDQGTPIIKQSTVRESCIRTAYTYTKFPVNKFDIDSVENRLGSYSVLAVWLTPDDGPPAAGFLVLIRA